MKVILYVIIILGEIFQAGLCLEFDESAWMDNIGRNKYFRNTDSAYVHTSYSNNIEFKLHHNMNTRVRPTVEINRG